ncbi:hypothetical protein [Dactylosporangium sp. NPDC051541]|uniref:hypothetical protein n=1 Tax=Dactylosporangium sp. NPDC051541 TaxID=3363977 RepID=UPI003791E768
MRGHRFAALTLVLTVSACGPGGNAQPADTVPPLPRSTLSAQVPAVDDAALAKALPDQQELGFGWNPITDSGRIDVIAGYAQGTIKDHCPWADAARAGLTDAGAPHLASTAFLRREHETISISVTVDAPASAADHLAYLRRVVEHCGTVALTAEPGVSGQYSLAPRPAPKLDADDVVAYTLKIELLSTPSPPAARTSESSEEACARAGAVVVCVQSANVTGLVDPLLTRTLQRARATPGLAS